MRAEKRSVNLEPTLREAVHKVQEVTVFISKFQQSLSPLCNLKTTYTGLFTHQLFTSLSPPKTAHETFSLSCSSKNGNLTRQTLQSIHADVFAVHRLSPSGV